MNILVTIISINIIVWLFPPIKQYRRTFFYYFLIFAVSDPINILLFKTLGIKPVENFLILSYLLFISILEQKIIKRYYPVFLISVTLITALSLNFLDEHSSIMMLIIVHTVIFFVFLSRLILTTTKTYSLNFFYLALNFYEATLLIKFLILVLKVETGVVYFYFTSVFQLLFGIYFSLADEEKPLLNVNLNTSNPDI